MKISEYSRKNTYIYYINKRIIFYTRREYLDQRYYLETLKNMYTYLTLIRLSYSLYNLCIDCAHLPCKDACAFSALMSTGLRKVKYEDWTTHDSLYLCCWQQLGIVSNKLNRVSISSSKVAICGCSASMPRFDHNSL